jgi:hypothetical protein
MQTRGSSTGANNYDAGVFRVGQYVITSMLQTA